jgi:phosphoribosylaminoimidazolecarboxamide formyltransferase/IMP cyclohydrolase
MPRALISVSDKTNLIDFARTLHDWNIEILSTGGTAKLLREQNISVLDVTDYTLHPEIMDGRVKTLHPKVHGGLLGRCGIDDAVMDQMAITPIDLLIVNLYPFEKTVANPHCSLSDAIENIDIGGPAMVRSAAKNYQRVTVIVDPADYAWVLQELTENNGQTTLETRFQLAQKAFAHTAAYDAAIANYLTSRNTESKFPKTFTVQFHKKEDLRYGENSHQDAALYVASKPSESCISTATQLHGKELSYNNIADAETAFECVKQFTQPACVIVKHANPCGAAQANNLLDAYLQAFACDKTSAFGGIIAFNQKLSITVTEKILQNQFVEVIVAPEIEAGVLDILAAKKNVRLLCTGPGSLNPQPEWDYKKITGGLLIQDKDILQITLNDFKIVTQRQPSAEDIQDCLFAWKICHFVKSNAIVYAKNQSTLGIGAGQMSRVVSVKIGAMKAEEEGLPLTNSVLASDAFFPFRDGIDIAVAAGVRTIIQPGGSIQDNAIIAAADELDIAMIFTGVRHFRH